MPESALTGVLWEAQEDAHVSSLLRKGKFVFDGNGEPFELSLILALANLSVSHCAMPMVECFLAAVAHEVAGVVQSMAPMMLTRLLGLVPFLLLSC
jgi:hypothetical protein